MIMDVTRKRKAIWERRQKVRAFAIALEAGRAVFDDE